VIADLRGRTAVVTGAASGIGLALCDAFLGAGMNVAMADVDLVRLRAAAARLTEAHGTEPLVVATDVTRYDAVEALARTADERFGAVGVLCNNAGVTIPGLSWELTLDEWRWIVDVNLWGVVHGIKAFLPAMLEHGAPAHVVNTASVGGLRVGPNLGVYHASKAALIHLTRQLALELAPKVRVNAVAPGVVRTRLAEALWKDHEPEVVSLTPLGRIGEPEDVGATVAFLASDAASWITGDVIVMDGGQMLGAPIADAAAEALA
jgi:NAD(P)-dependent dehydrogenase (short-subunit alcohol dehydrogenase family)